MQKPPDLDINGKPIVDRPPDIPIQSQAPPVQSAAPVQETKSVEEEEADSFLDQIIGTLYGSDNSKLPAIKGVTRPILPKSGEGDWDGWGDMKALYDNVVRPSSSLIGAATDWMSGKVIGGAIKGARGLKTIANRISGNPVQEVLNIPNASGTTTVRGSTDVINQAEDILNPVGQRVANAKNVTPERPLSPPVAVTPKFGQTSHNIAAQIDIGSKLPIGNRLKIRGIPSPEDVKFAKSKGLDFTGEITDDGRYVFTKVNEGTPVGQLPILESEVGNIRPTRAHANKLGPDTDVKKSSTFTEVVNLPRAIMASNDLSAPLRQGLGLIHKKAFWTSLPDMFRAWGSENTFRALQEEIASRPLFMKRTVKEVNDIGEEVVKELPSFADDAGLKLTDLVDLSSREEALMSTWAEKIPGVRRSNRAYTIFLNKLRADTFDDLVASSKVFEPGMETDLKKARALADFINTATGRGDLGALERNAVLLNSMFFSPRLIASRIQLPLKLISQDATVRKEALKSIAAIAAFGNTIGQLGKFAGGTVESDPASADFGKMKIGDVRADPFGGFQQYVVLMNRLSPQAINPMGGRFKSSTSNSEYSYSDVPFGRDTRKDTLEKFLVNKTNPIASFAYGVLKGKNMQNQPYDIPDEIAQRMVPILVQDIIELATENPKLMPGVVQLLKREDLKMQNVPLAIPSAFGMSVQKYGSNRGGQ